MPFQVSADKFIPFDGADFGWLPLFVGSGGAARRAVGSTVVAVAIGPGRGACGSRLSIGGDQVLRVVSATNTEAVGQKVA